MFEALDPRVHMVPAAANLRTTGRGHFVIPLSAGDVLAPGALFEVLQAHNTHADMDIAYFDEDRLSEDGTRPSAPWFKPGWSPDMLLSVNYLSHAAFRRGLLDANERIAGLDNIRLWDLALRASARARRVHHIAKVLYHSRNPGHGAAPPPDLRFLEEHCWRLGIPNARAAIVRPGVTRVTWPAPHRKVSIIIPTKDHVDLLNRCLTSLTHATAYENVEILLVDTGSTNSATQRYYHRLARDTRVRILEWHGPFNFSAVNNMAARTATGQLLLFLNNDTEAVGADWLEEMARWAQRSEVGVVGAKLLYPDRTIQHAGLVVGMYGLVEHIYRYAEETRADIFGSVDWYRNYLAVTGACMMMRREVFDEIGGFDEGYEVAMSDVEICLRVAARGYRVVYTPFARLWHHEGATRGQYAPRLDTLRACEQMEGWILSGDPYFNPNLSRTSAIPSLPRRGEPTPLQLFERVRRKASSPGLRLAWR